MVELVLAKKQNNLSLNHGLKRRKINFEGGTYFSLVGQYEIKKLDFDCKFKYHMLHTA